MSLSFVNIVLLDLSLLSVLTAIGFVLMSFVLQVEAQECEIGDPGFPFCHNTNDNKQEEEDQGEEEQLKHQDQDKFE
jgi:hypothetical protein